MAILLLADHDDSHLSDQTAKALTAATQIAKEQGSEVTVLVAGAGAKAAAEQAAKLSGVSKVLVAEDASLANNLAEPLAALIVSLAASYDTIIAAACRLPLSDSNRLSQNVHMRHRAGLGVTEQLDCVALIVSEERGTISYAKEGRLRKLMNAHELRDFLNRELRGDDPGNALDRTRRRRIRQGRSA